MSEIYSDAARERTPLRARHVLYGVLGVLFVAFVAAPQLWSPWVYFTGGSFHATPWWSGAGSFKAPDGTYQLYLYLKPMNTGSHPSYDTSLVGEGHLCTPSGKRLVMHVSGDMEKHLPWNTVGKAIEISTYVRDRLGIHGPTPPGSPYVKLSGVWGTGRIEAKGTLEHQPALSGHPQPPPPAPIAVTLEKASDWWAPACPAR